MTHQGRPGLQPNVDRRQSERALEIARGSARLLAQHGLHVIAELSLANGRRADLVALGPSGEFWIVEIKSSVADFRADQKWPEYREFCDRLFFAVARDFPREILPDETGVILADRYDGLIVRDAPEHRLAGARRRALTLRFARVAAARLMSLAGPSGLDAPGLPRHDQQIIHEGGEGA